MNAPFKNVVITLYNLIFAVNFFTHFNICFVHSLCNVYLTKVRNITRGILKVTQHAA